MSNRKKLKPWRQRPYAIQESAATATLSPLGIDPGVTAPPDTAPERSLVREASVGGTTVTAPGRLLVRLIKAGWSLNNNYWSAEVLRRDGPTAWPQGTHLMIDHAPPAEDEAYPVGTIRNLAAVLTSPARWDEASQSLIAEARLFAPWRETITDMADAIGLSVRAWVTVSRGEAEGREGEIIESIPEGRSVDFVTVPAAGGEIISVLEAVGHQRPAAEARNLGAWLESRLHLRLTELGDELYGDGRLTRGERITLSAAIGDALQAWTTRVEQDAPQLFQRDLFDDPQDAAPAMANESPAAGPTSTAPPEPVVVAAAEDVTDGAPPTAPPSTEEEPAMSGTTAGAPPVEAGTATVADTPAGQAAEAVTTQPTPAQPDVAAIVAEAIRTATAPLLEQVQQMQAREAARDAETRAERNRARAREAVESALQAPDLADVRQQIGPRVTGNVLAAVPTTAEGGVDEAALASAVSAAVAAEAAFVRQTRAEALEAAGVGNVFGLGGNPVEESEKDTSGLTEALSGLFNTIGLTSEQSKVAVAGRGF